MFIYDENLSEVLEEAHTRRNWWLEYIAGRDEMLLRNVDAYADSYCHEEELAVA